MNLRKKLALMLANLRKRLAVIQVSMEFTNRAMDLLIDKGYDDEYGARPLRRVIQRNIDDKLSEEILRGELESNSSILIDEQDGQFVFIKN